MTSMFPKARTGVDFWRSPVNGALGYMPEYAEHAKEYPIEITIGEKQLTDEEIEKEAALVRECKAFLKDYTHYNGVLTHRQTIHEAYAQVRDLKKRMRELEASFGAKN